MCCLPCSAKRAGKIHTTTEPPLEAPRPATQSTPKKQKQKEKHPLALAQGSPAKRFPVQQVHQNLIDHLAQPPRPKQEAAHLRLRAAFLAPAEHLSPSFFDAVIADLDTLLFNDALGDRVYTDWANMTVTRRRMLRGISLPYDICRSGISKVRVRLNKRMFGIDSKDEIWGTVVHELLHAYLDLMSNWAGLVKAHHGTLFERSCRAMVQKLGLEGFGVMNVI